MDGHGQPALLYIVPFILGKSPQFWKETKKLSYESKRMGFCVRYFDSVRSQERWPGDPMDNRGTREAMSSRSPSTSILEKTPMRWDCSFFLLLIDAHHLLGLYMYHFTAPLTEANKTPTQPFSFTLFFLTPSPLFYFLTSACIQGDKEQTGWGFLSLLY